MSGPIRLHRAAVQLMRLLPTAILALSFFTAPRVVTSATDPPPTASGQAQALAERKKLLADRDQLDNKCRELEAQGKYSEAITVEEESLSVERRLFGDVNLEVAASLEWIARLQSARGDLASERKARTQVLSIVTKLLGSDDWHVADERVAIANLDLASKLTDQQWKDLLQATQANSQLVALNKKGDFLGAIPFAKQAMAIRKRILGDRHRDTAQSLNNLALLYQSIGENATAEPLLREALEIRLKLQGSNHPGTAIALNNLAALYASMGNYARAEPLYRKSLEINTNALTEDHPNTATSLNNLASLYDSMGDTARAEPYYRKALQINRKVLGKNDPNLIASILNLANLYEAVGDYERAKPLYQEALEIPTKVLGENHPATASSLTNMADLYKSMGEYSKAEPLYRRALEIRIKALGENHPDTGSSLNRLALLYYSTGDYAKAEQFYRQALIVRVKALGEFHPDTAQSVNNLAGLYDSQGDLAKAEPFYRHALAAYEKHFVDTLRVQSERQQLLMCEELRNNLDAYLSFTWVARSSATDVYRHVLVWKGAVFVRQFADHALRHRSELKPLLDELVAINVRLSTLALRGIGARRRDLWEDQVAELSRQKESLEQTLSEQSAEFHEEQKLLDAKPEDLQRVLPASTALVDFLEYWHVRPSTDKRGQLKWERHLAAFVVRRDRPIVRFDLGPVKPLAEAAESWRRVLLHSGTAPDVGRPIATPKAPQESLKEMIWIPLQRSLDGVETVLISPDGVLNRIPLSALPGEKPGSYLVEQIKLAVVPVPRLLLKTQGKQSQEDTPDSAARPSLLLVGDVTYGGSPGRAERLVPGVRSALRGTGEIKFAELAATRSEIATIRAAFEKDFADRKVNVLCGDKATESAFRGQAPMYRWLHLATHGFFAPPEIASALAPPKEVAEARFNEFTRKGISGSHPGLLSGIALSGANASAKEDEDDGILTAVDVAGMDLERADLVVLSACETGLGTVAGGEGVLGLQRALQLAGAKSCITSIWKVDDAATQVLMAEFYTNLWQKKLGKLDALRQAQLRMLHEYDPQQKKFVTRGLDISLDKADGPGRGSPFYWAAFVLSGDWR